MQSTNRVGTSGHASRGHEAWPGCIMFAAVMAGRSFPARKIGRDLGQAALPGHDVQAAEQRMSSAVQQLKRVGCHATGVITGQRQLVNAVRAETHGRNYDEVIVVTGRRSPWLVRALGLDPVQRLRLRLGHRLVALPLGAAAPQATPVWS